MRKKTLLALTLSAFALAAPVIAQPQASAGATIVAERMGEWGIDTAGMDTSVKPGDDFFGYVNGTWARNTPIPSDRSSFGAFHSLRDLSEKRVRALVESYPAVDPASGGDQAKVGALYRGFMDEAAIDALDAEPILSRLAAIRAVSSKQELARMMGESMGGPGASFFTASVSDDRKDPEHYALYLSQSGLGLSDRSFYLEERFAPQKTRYQSYVAEMLGLVGWPDPERHAAGIVALETAVAEGHWTRAESRDRTKTYNATTLAGLRQSAPGFPWDIFAAAAGIEGVSKWVAAEDSAFPRLAAAFAAVDLDTLKAWQAFHTVDRAAPLLSKRFADARFEFRDKFLQGQPEQRERWKRGVAVAEEAMGEAIGRDYVALYFPPDAKAKMDALVANVRAAMKRRIEGLAWMGPETKREALAKLAQFGLKIGYPENWRDYSPLEIRNGDLFGNVQRARRFEWDYNRARIGKPVDKGEWGMTPQTVNAYYTSVKNEIVFPAAILQPPFFDPDADPAVNYGAIGGVIGHEITHGFDDQGRKSDGNGLQRDWWTADDAAKFEAQAAILGSQYEAYEFPTLPGMHINGRIAMGENIGDLGGVLVALDAYHASLGGKPAPVVGGFTGDQRVFLGWAQIWRTLWRDDALRQQIVNGPHSPGQIRAFAPLRNVDAWYDAFGVKPGDTLYVAPEDRVRIW